MVNQSQRPCIPLHFSSDRSYRKINWETYSPSKKTYNKEFEKVKQLYCIAFKQSNFRNYYKCT